jgi:streptogramin lyase
VDCISVLLLTVEREIRQDPGPRGAHSKAQTSRAAAPLVPLTVAALGHAATRIKRRPDAADKYPVSRKVGRLTAALASVAALVALPASASASRVTEFSAGLTVANTPAEITTGPDGNLWFTEQGLLPRIGKLDPADGAITEYAIGALNTPGDITVGPDSAIWFTQRGATDALVRVDPADGTMQEHTLPSGTAPTALTAGADGNLWFIESGTDKLGRMQLDGTHDKFNAGLSGSDTLNDIAAGPDGQLWVTIEGDDDEDNRIESFSPSNPDDPCFWSAGLTGAPNKIVAASDGRLYFTITGDPASIGRVKTDGTITEYRTGLTADSRPVGIAEGGDEALWFTADASPGRIGRMDRPSYDFTEFAGGTPGLGLLADANPAGITRGPDGNVWFTESGLDGKIARMTVPPAADLELVQAQDLIGRHEITNGELKASVTPNSQETTFHVEYGPDSNFGEQTEPVTVTADVAGADAVTETVPLTLEPSSHYHAQLVASNGSGEARSRKLELWTDANGNLLDYAPQVPEVEEPELPQKPGTGSPTTPDLPAPSPIAGAAPLAPPVLGEAVIVRPVRGSVKVKTPGSRSFSPLAAGANLPVGTGVDARDGRILLQSARDKRGRTQNGTFWGAVFQIRQSRSGKGMTNLVLRGGSFARCGTRAGISVLARESRGKRRVVRRLWGKDKHARFRTHGRDSVATVRGTRWVTTDRCDGTVTRVTQGAVMVRDLRKKRKVLVKAGDSYLARHRHHR